MTIDIEKPVAEARTVATHAHAHPSYHEMILESLLESPSYKASRIALKKQIHARYPSATAKGAAFDHHLARALSEALDSKELRVKKQTYQLLKAGKEALVKHYHNKKAVEALREHVEEEHEEEEEEHEEEAGEEQEEVEEEEVELEQPQQASKKHSQSHPSYHEMMLVCLLHAEHFKLSRAAIKKAIHDTWPTISASSAVVDNALKHALEDAVEKKELHQHKQTFTLLKNGKLALLNQYKHPEAEQALHKNEEEESTTPKSRRASPRSKTTPPSAGVKRKASSASKASPAKARKSTSTSSLKSASSSASRKSSVSAVSKVVRSPSEMAKLSAAKKSKKA